MHYKNKDNNTTENGVIINIATQNNSNIQYIENNEQMNRIININVSQNIKEIKISPDEKPFKDDDDDGRNNLIFSRINDIEETSDNNNNKYKIIEYIKTIGDHKNKISNLFVKEINKELYISGGDDNDLYIYHNFIIIDIINNPDHSFIESIYVNDKKKITQIICLSKDKGKTFITELKNKNLEISKTPLHYNVKINASEIFELGKGNFKHIFYGSEGVFIINDLFNMSIENKEIEQIKTGSYKGIIKISDNIILLIQNNFNKEDKFEFFNLSKKKPILSKNLLKGLFIKSGKDCCLIPLKETEKMLLCPCKKYSKKIKKNENFGILLMNIKLDEKNLHKFEFNTFLYDMPYYDVKCFCPISNPDNYIDNINIINYFLIGSFAYQKNTSTIKLAQIKYNDNNFLENKIEVILNIVFDNYDFGLILKCQITCMMQTKNGYILIAFSNGKVCLLSKPNLNL